MLRRLRITIAEIRTKNLIEDTEYDFFQQNNAFRPTHTRGRCTFSRFGESGFGESGFGESGFGKSGLNHRRLCTVCDNNTMALMSFQSCPLVGSTHGPGRVDSG